MTNKKNDTETIDTTVNPTGIDNNILVVGTFDTKKEELDFIKLRLMSKGVNVKTVDLSTSGKKSDTDILCNEVASAHPDGVEAVFTGDRGTSVAAMALAFERWTKRTGNISGMISAGGSGGTALVTPAMRVLPIGVPKIMVSTVASGNVASYVGSSDINMVYSVTDIAGINRISRQVLGNASDAMAGMATSVVEEYPEDKQSIGITMFGVTTTAVQSVIKELEAEWECLVFHATGTGGRSMEKLAESGFLAAAIDLTTTEIADYIVGGVFAADEDRFGSFIRNKIPWIGSVGALDMVNFGAVDTVPEKFKGRKFYEHNPQVTLMRTTVDENIEFGKFIANKINQMEGPVRFLLPEGGLSALDAPGQPFDDPQARNALYSTIEKNVKPASNRKIIRVPHHINDIGFNDVSLIALSEITR